MATYGAADEGSELAHSDRAGRRPLGPVGGVVRPFPGVQGREKNPDALTLPRRRWSRH
jgi:hypothetical protein